MYSKQELKSTMVLFNDRQEDLAAALGITPATLSTKINGDVAFKRDEIEIIALRYSLTPSGIRRIFFTDVVNQDEQ